MYTLSDIRASITALGILPTDTLLVHSSMKAIGEVEGRGDTVLDALIGHMAEGLLVLPTHTWDKVNGENPAYDVVNSPSCVGILTNLFRARPGVVRSWHPTHSVAAIGRDAQQYIAGDELVDTPCGRNGTWGKLYDRGAKILFLGCTLKRNTYLHGVEEWNNIPNRLREEPEQLYTVTPDGRKLSTPQHRHHCPYCQDVSGNYDKMELPMLHRGIAVEGRIGDARCVLVDAKGCADLAGEFLRRNPDLFANGDPVPEEWYN